MSTKSLGRTAVEVGRSGYQKFERRQRTRLARRIKLDCEGEPIPRVRKHGQVGGDRLRPLYGWLDAHVGKSWAKTYAEFCAKENKRSLRGYHIDSHLRESVRGAGTREFAPDSRRFSSHRYFIDARGILRKHQSEPLDRFPQRQFDEARAWTKSRLVTQDDGALYWVMVRRRLPEFGRLQIRRKLGGLMSREDAAYWHALDSRVQWELWLDPSRCSAEWYAEDAVEFDNVARARRLLG